VGVLALGPLRPELVTAYPSDMRTTPPVADDPERRFILRQADQARNDFAAILDELEFVKAQLARQPDRAWLSRMLLLGFGTMWALLGVFALWHL
jgi:hypothetical protein